MFIGEGGGGCPFFFEGGARRSIGVVRYSDIYGEEWGDELLWLLLWAENALVS